MESKTDISWHIWSNAPLSIIPTLLFNIESKQCLPEKRALAVFPNESFLEVSLLVYVVLVSRRFIS